MYGSGAGTGTTVIQTRRRMIPRARPRGLPALDAAGAGAPMPFTPVRLAGSAATRTTATSTTVSVSPSPSFQAQVRRHARPPGGAGRELSGPEGREGKGMERAPAFALSAPSKRKGKKEERKKDRVCKLSELATSADS